jgi:hypothetical protein
LKKQSALPAEKRKLLILPIMVTIKAKQQQTQSEPKSTDKRVVGSW